MGITDKWNRITLLTVLFGVLLNAGEVVRVHRRRFNTLDFAASSMAGGGLVLLAGFVFYVGYGTLQQKPREAALRFCAATGVCGAAGYWFLKIRRMRVWNERLEIPLVIFDSEGFTHEQMDVWGNYRTQHCKWSDVVNQWDRDTYDDCDALIKWEWQYQIRGVGHVVSINALELDIPDDMVAKVESARRGEL